MAARITVRGFIELMLVAQEIMEAERDPVAVFNAYDHLLEVVCDLAHESTSLRKLLVDLPLAELYGLAIRISDALLGDVKRPPDDGAGPEKNVNAGPEKVKDKSPPLAPVKISREELELPAWKMALVIREPISKIMDMDFNEFMRTEKIIEAALADLKLDLLPVLDYPHLTKEGRKKFVWLLEYIRRGIKAQDASPWAQHMKEARRLL